jgi:hypothetical protein
MPARTRKNEPAVDSITAPVAAGRSHSATYASDKRNPGRYLIRVEGPNAGKFAGRDVPVTLRNGDEHEEKLVKAIWAGLDQESGNPVALYSFEAKPREVLEESLPF